MDSNGVVTGNAAGSVTISATSVADPSVSDAISLDAVVGTINSVSITHRPSGDVLLVGVDNDLDATVDGTGTFSQNVIWTSSSPGVATVDTDGVVQGVAAGTTVITAAAASDNGVSDSFTLTVSDVSVDCSNPTVLSDVGTDTVLPLGCYSVAPNDVVSVTAALTIPAGTIVEFGRAHRLEAALGGSITATGDATHHIVLRGANPGAGFWDGVRFLSSSGANGLAFVDISDAGSDNLAGVYVDSTGSASVENTSVSASSIGLKAENGATLTSFADNAFSGNDLVADIYPSLIASLDGATDYAGSAGTANTDNFMRVHNGTSGAGTWPAANAPFHLNANQVAHHRRRGRDRCGRALRVRVQCHASRVDLTGSLKAVGTSSAPITFHGVNPTSGFWDGLDVRSNSPDNVLDHIDVTGAGSDNFAGVYVQSTGGVSLSNSTIASSSIGFKVENGGSVTAFAGNAFSGNDLVADIYPSSIASLDGATDYAGAGGTPNTNNYIQVENGTSGAGTWPATNAPFRVLANGVVTVDAAVVVTPGAQFEFGSSARLTVDSAGSLDASGTSADRIAFRGANASSGFWDGIDIHSTSSNNVLDFVDVSDGGSDNFADIYLQSTGSVTVTNSTITNSGTYGIDVESGGAITPATQADLTDPGIGNNSLSGNTLGDFDGIPAS